MPNFHKRSRYNYLKPTDIGDSRPPGVASVAVRMGEDLIKIGDVWSSKDGYTGVNQFGTVKKRRRRQVSKGLLKSWRRGLAEKVKEASSAQI